MKWGGVYYFQITQLFQILSDRKPLTPSPTELNQIANQHIQTMWALPCLESLTGHIPGYQFYMYYQHNQETNSSWQTVRFCFAHSPLVRDMANYSMILINKLTRLETNTKTYIQSLIHLLDHPRKTTKQKKTKKTSGIMKLWLLFSVGFLCFTV